MYEEKKRTHRFPFKIERALLVYYKRMPHMFYSEDLKCKNIQLCIHPRAKVTQLKFEADFSIEAISASKSNFQVSKFNFFSKQWYLNQLCVVKIKEVIEKWKMLVVKKKSQNPKKGHNVQIEGNFEANFKSNERS